VAPERDLDGQEAQGRPEPELGDWAVFDVIPPTFAGLEDRSEGLMVEVDVQSVLSFAALRGPKLEGQDLDLRLTHCASSSFSSSLSPFVVP
jgi:hypothetical protein